MDQDVKLDHNTYVHITEYIIVIEKKKNQHNVSNLNI